MKEKTTPFFVDLFARMLYGAFAVLPFIFALAILTLGTLNIYGREPDLAGTIISYLIAIPALLLSIGMVYQALSPEFSPEAKSSGEEPKSPKKTNKKRLIIISLVILIASCFTYWLVQAFLFKRNMKLCADIDVSLFTTRLYVKDGTTLHFMDADYYAKFKVSKEKMDQLLANPPAWAKGPWQKGRQTNLAEHFKIADNGKLVSVCGEKGTTVFLILTIDKKNELFYFEMREF